MAHISWSQRHAARGDGETPSTGKACGHTGHAGPCPCCQRHQLARWQAQLDDVAQRGMSR
jgi:hypothetical protein